MKRAGIWNKERYQKDGLHNRVEQTGEMLSAARISTEALQRGQSRVIHASLTLIRECAKLKLGGKRVGIIGLGNIGSRIAKRLQAFGCIIHYNSRKPKDSVSYKYLPNVHNLAAESDVLIVACALNKATRHIVNKDVLGALGKDGVVINIGRGANVDEEELVVALKEGKIAGAGLDVFEHEPNVPTELFPMDNVVLSRHSAVFTEESRSDLRARTIGNLEAFFSGQPLLTPVHAESLVQ